MRRLGNFGLFGSGPVTPTSLSNCVTIDLVPRFALLFYI